MIGRAPWGGRKADRERLANMKRIGVIGTTVITCVRECVGRQSKTKRDSRFTCAALAPEVIHATPASTTATLMQVEHRPAVSILQADMSSHINRIRFPKDFGGDLDAFSPIAILRQGMNRPTKKHSPYEPCAADASFAQCARLGSYGMLSQLCPPSARCRKD